MKKQILTILSILLSMLTQAQDRQKAIPGWEFHASVNHPISAKEGVRTFYGGGIGVNVIFKDTNRVSFKTGIELNYFHTWDAWLNSGNFSNQTNIHYQYSVLSIPALVRFNFGNELNFLVEFGAYLGFSVGGEMRSDYFSNDPFSNESVNGFKHENYTPGLSITPAIGFGTRLPLSNRLELLLKPEIAFTKNENYGEDSFNKHYFYARFCAGIHLKPKTKK
ncbi:hypothetical protein [Fluviicola taffensis]|uniref:hypothetical protein n=1 Tax=Fluviicola taffensis TaxID=191579 RepID=UPI0031378107